MSDKLKVVWENSPDTPLSASNLSKMIKFYNDDLILYQDTDDFINNSDGILKLRANTKISTQIETTSAYFSFDDSFVSHNSKYSFSTIDNVNFRLDTLTNSGKSLSIEQGTENILTNGDFSDDTAFDLVVSGTSDSIKNELNKWKYFASDQSNVTFEINQDDPLYGSNVAKSFTTAGSTCEVYQTIHLGTYLTSDDNPEVSISLYYKSNDNLDILVIGVPTSTTPLYWNQSGNQWEQIETTMSVPASDSWKRIEIKNIRTNSLFDNNEIRVVIRSNNNNQYVYVDGVQIEKMPFCTSFTPSIRSNSNLRINHKIMRLDQGLIDIQFNPKYFYKDGTVNNIFRLTMNEQDPNHPEFDAMRLEFDQSSELIRFSVYDVNSNSEIKLLRSTSTAAYNSLIDDWQRIIVAWDKEVGLKLSLNGELPIKRDNPFTPINNSELIDIEIGGSDINVSNILIDEIKFNIFTKTDDSIVSDYQEFIMPDPNINKLFEVENEAIQITPELLDSSSEFEPNTNYYVYICDDEGIVEETRLIVSTSNISPIGRSSYFSYLIGGFKTDSSAKIINSSIWDSIAEHFKTLILKRLLINGRSSETADVEFRSYPHSQTNEAVYNVPLVIKDHLYGQNTSNFFDLDANTGVLYIDSVMIDSNKISSNNGEELYITGDSPGNGTAHIESTIVNIDSKSGGSIQLDGFRIRSDKMYAPSGNNIEIGNDQSNSELVLNSYTGYIRSIGSNIVLDNTNITFNPGSTLQINTGSSVTAIDTITFDNDTISSKPGTNLRLDSDQKVRFTAAAVADSQIQFSDTHRQKMQFVESNPNYGLGTQNNLLYNRSARHFAWFSNGSHSDTIADPGSGGTLAALLTTNNTLISGLGATIDPNSRFYAGRVHNAVWNDLAECWIKDDDSVSYGDVVVRNENGVFKSNKRAQKATIGIVSNTYGFLLGDEGFHPKLEKSIKVPIAISGRVKTHYTGRIQIGDELVSNKNGGVIKANIIEKIFKRDRIIGIVDSIQDNETCTVKV